VFTETGGAAPPASASGQRGLMPSSIFSFS
jgi:hypothetical protein